MVFYVSKVFSGSCLLMGDFNMCVDASQSTSRFSLMDSPEQAVLDKFASEVLMLNVWKWLHQDEVGFTFQSMQYKGTWSGWIECKLCMMSPFYRRCLIVNYVEGFFEYNKHVVYMYKTIEQASLTWPGSTEEVENRIGLDRLVRSRSNGNRSERPDRREPEGRWTNIS